MVWICVHIIMIAVNTVLNTVSCGPSLFTFVSAFQLTVPVFLIFQYLMNFVPGRSRVPSGRFSSKNAAIIAGTTRGHGRFGRLHKECQVMTPPVKKTFKAQTCQYTFFNFSIFNCYQSHFLPGTYSGLLCWVARGCRSTGEELPSLWEELHCMPRLSILSCFRISLTSAFNKRFSAFSRCFSAFRKLRSPRR